MQSRNPIRGTAGPATGAKTAYLDRRVRAYFAIAVVGSAVVVGLTCALIARERQGAFKEWEARVSSVADGQARVVADWLENRSADAREIAGLPSLIALLHGVTDMGPTTAERAQALDYLTAVLNRVVRAHHYAGLYILNPAGEVVAQSATAVPGAQPERMVLAAVRNGRAATATFVELGGQLYLNVSAPVFPADGGSSSILPLGVVMLFMEASETLFPLFRVVTFQGLTAETLLFRRDGDDVVLVSPLGSTLAGVPQVRVSARATTPEAMATAMGQSIAGDYTDYRGVPVIEAVRWVPGTDWGLVRKIDREEALAHVRSVAVLEVVAAGLLMVAFGGLLVVQWRGERIHSLEERMRQHRALERFHDVVQGVDAIVYEAVVLEVNGAGSMAGIRLASVSQRIEDIFGYPVEQWTTLPHFWAGRIHPDDRNRTIALYGAAVAEGRDHSIEYRLIRSDGCAVWVRDRLRVVRDDDGRACLIRGVVVDVSEHKHALELAAGQRRVLEMISTGAPLRAVLEALARTVEAQSDDLLCAIFLLGADGRSLSCAAAPRLPDACARAIEKVAVTSAAGAYSAPAYLAREVIVPDIAADAQWAEAHRDALAHGLRACWSTPIRGRDSQVVGTLVVYHRVPRSPTAREQALMESATDVASIAIERTRADDSLRQLNADLEQRVAQRTAQLEVTNKELEAFSYSVSHDLRAPLRVVEGFSRSLLEQYGASLDARGRDRLERLHAAAGRMQQLINDLLHLAHVARSEMRRESVDLSALAQTIITDLQKTQPERRVTLWIDDRVVAAGDRRLLRIAMENLLGNAWKFTAKQPSAIIELGVTESGGWRVYFVRDNGAGFDMTHASKLFGAFQRLHSRDEFDGTGIGLATVRRVVHRHGGRIWAEAEVDRGATFYFTLDEMNGAGGGAHPSP